MKIGVVGNIAAGKMTVARIFEEFGFNIVDADKIGWQVIEEPDIKSALTQEFGSKILVSDKIDRHRLGRIVFKDKRSLRRLNEIVHPRLIERLRDELDRDGDLVVDCALLDKFGLLDQVDYIILVRASREERKKRLIDAGLTDSEPEERIESQEDDNRFLKVADFIIDNNSDLGKLREDCYRIWQEVTSDNRL